MIGLPHPKWVERPLLLVVPRPGQQPTKDAILAHLKVSCCSGWTQLTAVMQHCTANQSVWLESMHAALPSSRDCTI